MPFLRASRRAGLLAFALLLAACGPSKPPRDPIAETTNAGGAATREGADDPTAGVLGGTSSYRSVVTCGEERWFRLDPGPFTRGEIRVFARLQREGARGHVEVDILGEEDRLVDGRFLTIRALAPAFETLVVPFAAELPSSGPRPRFWVRVRAGEPCAPVDFVVWFREPAMVGP